MTYFPLKDLEDLSKMLIWHRKRGKITQQMLADLAGVSRTAIQRLESGATTGQIDTLWKVLKILNIKPFYSGPLMERCMNELAPKKEKETL